MRASSIRKPGVTGDSKTLEVEQARPVREAREALSFMVSGGVPEGELARRPDPDPHYGTTGVGKTHAGGAFSPDGDSGLEITWSPCNSGCRFPGVWWVHALWS